MKRTATAPRTTKPDWSDPARNRATAFQTHDDPTELLRRNAVYGMDDHSRFRPFPINRLLRPSQTGRGFPGANRGSLILFRMTDRCQVTNLRASVGNGVRTNRKGSVMLTYQEECHVRDIIAYWRHPLQQIKVALHKAVAAHQERLIYVCRNGKGDFVKVPGWALFIGEAIAWRAKL